ncbi:MAG TPA: PLP-dependent aminotransferase family protein [Candidatus Anaerobutyricum stercoripullorum]|uniref:PLP-dependent aminotransferase family protein n=1 Tax=Candidatus Anaerobutyricum stercoripullorum TaxID=2838456 RepID=A0A9D2BDK4_9FIRM|nr:PLP-dependent aminotransferase family protein [Candidatus Anaerobutyricum stercoripullorum]
MLTYSFENIGHTPLYEHLYKCIKNDIMNGTLPAGTKLPSKRSFASNLGVSAITVENAYAQLLSEGYIYSRPKKGYYVSTFSRSLLPPRAMPETAVALPEARPVFFADFSSNQTRPDNFPFSVWAKLMRETMQERNNELMTKPPCGGIFELREAIASHLKQFRDMQVQPEQIFVGAGTEYLYGLLVQLLGFDKVYAIENPGYEKIAQIYESYQVRRRFIDMDDCGIRMDRLEESGADVVHISPSHHFPTGIITPVSRRYELLGWAAKSDSRYIIEDDYDSEFRLTGKPIPALQSIDLMEKVIYINTFSKSLTSTMRISYMVLPPGLAQRFLEQMSFYSCTVSNFEQYALMRFIREGYLEKHINRMRNYYHRQRDALLDAIKKSPLSSRVTITEEDSGLHFLMKIDTALSDTELMEKAREKGLRLTALSRYYHRTDSDVEHIFIINYSYLKTEHIPEAIRRLYQCLTD